jgi:hypothetical protein
MNHFSEGEPNFRLDPPGEAPAGQPGRWPDGGR